MAWAVGPPRRLPGRRHCAPCGTPVQMVNGAVEPWRVDPRLPLGCLVHELLLVDLPQSLGPSPRVFEPAQTAFRKVATRVGLTETLPFPGGSLKAEEGTRTPDLPLTRRLLYQLSYFGTVGARDGQRPRIAARAPNAIIIGIRPSPQAPLRPHHGPSTSTRARAERGPDRGRRHDIDPTASGRRQTTPSMPPLRTGSRPAG